MKEQGLDIRKYYFMFKRRAVLAATAFLLVLAAGVLYCLAWPPVYAATCLVVVQPQKVPGDIIKATVTTKIQERLQIITQQVLSRSRLMEIIERFDLYPNARENTPPDQLADRMRQDITIKITTKKNYFTVNYVYADPKTVAAVTNALAAFYVDSNLRLREEDAVGTSRFLKRELDRMTGQLREWESRITKYKKEHLQELPESRQQNLILLQQIRDRMSHIERTMQSERIRHGYLDNEIGVLEWRKKKAQMEMARLRRMGAATGSDDYGGDEANPEAIKIRLKSLRLRYKEDHPDIVRLTQLLATVEAEAAARKKARASAMAKGEKPPPQEDEAQAAIANISLSVERLGKRVAELKAHLRELEAERQEKIKYLVAVQQRLDNAPQVAEELLRITRGYEELKDAYETMHSRALEANMAANLERTQRGEQFEVIDPAEVPEDPFRPDVRRAIPISIGLALALALGLTVGLGYLDTSFTSVEQMEREGNLPVLVVIPPLRTRADRLRSRSRLTLLWAIYGGAFVVLLGLVGILVTGRGQSLKRFVAGIFS